MDYETKIYLEKLIEAVSSTDWWSIGITAVNALIVVALTIWQLCLNKRQTKIQERQNELQEQQNQLQKIQTNLMEQQTKAQEYDLYRKLYKIVNDIYKLGNDLCSYVYLGVKHFYSINNDYWSEYKNRIEELENLYNENEIDLKLKFEKYKTEISCIKSQLFIAQNIISKIQQSYNDGFLNILQANDIDEITEFFDKSNDVRLFDILGNITNENTRKVINQGFLLFNNICKKAYNQGLLDDIKSKL